MCGIIAVVRRPTSRSAPSADAVRERLATAVAALTTGGARAEVLDAASAALEEADRLLRGAPGILSLLQNPGLSDHVRTDLTPFDEWVQTVEEELEQSAITVPAAELEALNAGLIRLRDALWALRVDRLAAAERVQDLAAGDAPTTMATTAAFAAVDIALSALDRLEVRGRDSAGLSIAIHGLDENGSQFRELLGGRTPDPLYTNAAVRHPAPGHLDLVYKHAAEIGELGDNVRALRTTMRQDPLLQWALRAEGTEVTVLGHTRWASVGIISEPNAHPLNQEETDGVERPYVVAALNGDVDNHNVLREEHGLAVPDGITTDAKVIPALVSRRLAAGDELVDAFRNTVASFEGSVAIGARAADHPRSLLLALRGSGQALYVGVDDGVFVVASEPYGVVEETQRYLRMDGETPGNPANPQASRGQILVLDGAAAGEVAGITRVAYDGTPLAGHRRRAPGGADHHP